MSNCGTCKFYDGDGECHKAPPIRLPRKFVSDKDRTRDETLNWGWPTVKASDWCGEYQQ